MSLDCIKHYANYMHVDIIGTLMWFMIPPILNSWVPCLKQEARRHKHRKVFEKYVLKAYTNHARKSQCPQPKQKLASPLPSKKGLHLGLWVPRPLKRLHKWRTLCRGACMPPRLGITVEFPENQLQHFLESPSEKIPQSLRAQRRFGQFSLVNRICLDESLGWIEESILYHHDCHGFWCHKLRKISQISNQSLLRFVQLWLGWFENWGLSPSKNWISYLFEHRTQNQHLDLAVCKKEHVENTGHGYGKCSLQCVDLVKFIFPEPTYDWWIVCFRHQINLFCLSPVMIDKH